MLIDTQAYYARIHRAEEFSNKEIEDLLNELVQFRGIAAYVASIHAATTEALPENTDRMVIQKYAQVCVKVGKAISGEVLIFGHKDYVLLAKQRCEHAALMKGEKLK